MKNNRLTSKMEEWIDSFHKKLLEKKIVLVANIGIKRAVEIKYIFREIGINIDYKEIYKTIEGNLIYDGLGGIKAIENKKMESIGFIFWKPIEKKISLIFEPGEVLISNKDNEILEAKWKARTSTKLGFKLMMDEITFNSNF